MVVSCCALHLSKIEPKVHNSLLPTTVVITAFPPVQIFRVNNRQERKKKRQIPIIQGKPWYMALFAQPRDPKGSMTEGRQFEEFKEFYEKIKSQLVISESPNRTITYMDFCEPMCDFNGVLFMTYVSFRGEGEVSCFSMDFTRGTVPDSSWAYSSRIYSNPPLF